MADPLFTIEGRLAISPQEEAAFLRRMQDIQNRVPVFNFKTSGGGFADLNRDVSSFTSYLDRANQRVIGFTSSVTILYSTIKVFKDIVTSTIEVDKALTDINSVMKLSSTNLDKFSKDLFDAARATSSSFGEAAEAAKDFSRQGLSVEETLRRTKDALTLSRLAGIDLSDSIKELTESTNIFQKSGVTTTDVVKALTTVSSHFAVSTKDISDAFTRFGAVAQQAGLSFNQTISLITAVEQTSQRAGAAVGTALTSIFEKLQPKDAIEQLNHLGVVVKDTSGNTLPLLNIVENLAKQYGGLAPNIQATIDKMVGGSRQIEILKAGIIQLANSNGTYIQTNKLLANGSDDVTARLNAQNQSIQNLLSNFGTAAKQISSNIGQLSVAPLLKNVLGAANDNPITKALEDASGSASTAGGKLAEGILRGLGDALIYGLGPILALAASKVVSGTFGSLFNDIKDQASLNDAAKAQASIQKEIINLYAAGGDKLQAQLATMNSLAERAAYLAAILNDVRASTGAQAAQLSVEAGLVSKLIPRAASGYLSVGQESAAIAAGVGGAPPTAHAVVIPNFRYGPGLVGPIVANSSEYKVNLGSGDAIYNQDMIKQLGFPSNATPIAAGGYTPFGRGDGQQILRNAAGQPLSNDALSAINDLLNTLSQTNGSAIAGTAAAIKNLISSLNADSQNAVIRAAQAASAPVTGSISSQASPELFAQYLAQRQSVAGFGNPGTYKGGNSGGINVGPLGETFAEIQLQKSLKGLSNDQLLDLLDTTGGAGLTGNITRTQAIQGARRQLIPHPTDIDRIATTIGLGRSGTLNTDFANQVKTSLGDGMSLEEAYKEASDAYIQAGGSAKRLATAQTSLLESLIGYENSIKLGSLDRISTQGSIGRQTILNAANQSLAGGASFDTLTTEQQAAVVNKLKLGAIQKLGFTGSTADILNNKDASIQINQVVAQQLAQIKSANSLSTNTLGIGGSNPGWFSRANSYLGRGNLGLAAAIGLPFAGGALDQWLGDAGGTDQGKTIGAISGALTGAGTGIGAGLLVGQPLAGAAIGAAVGGVKGLLDKLTMSFSELADTVTKRNNEIRSNYDKAAKVFEAQAQLSEARNNGAGSETINRLTRNRDAAISDVSDARVYSLITKVGALNNPATRGAVDDIYSTDQISSNNKAALQTAAIAALEASSDISHFQLTRNGKLQDTPSNNTAVNTIATGVRNSITSLSPQQIQGLKTLLDKNPQAAFDFLQHRGGLSWDEVNSTHPNFITDSDTYPALVKAGITKAINTKPDLASTTKADDEASNAAANLTKQIREMAQYFQIAAKVGEVVTQGFIKITDAINKTIQATTLQTKADEIAQQGVFDQANIRTTFSSQISQTSQSARAGLLGVLGKSGLDGRDPNVQSLIDKVANAKSINDFVALQTLFNSRGGTPITGEGANEYSKLLQEAVDKLKEISVSEQVSLRVASVTNELLQIQNTSKERDTLLSNSKYDPALFNQIELSNRLGNLDQFSGFGQQSLLNAQSGLNSLGLPATQTSLDYASGLQEDRTRSTLARILSNRLGRNVGTEDQDLKSAALSLNPDIQGNSALSSQILAAADPKTGLLNFDASSRIKAVQTSIGGGGSLSDFQNTLQFAGLSTTDSLLATGFKSVVDAIKGAGGVVDVLKNGKNTSAKDTATGTQSNPATGYTMEPFVVGSKNNTASPLLSSSNNPFTGFYTGFQGASTSYTTAIQDMANIGASVADSIQSHFNRLWDGFATGTVKSRIAFREFAAGITGDASKAFADKAFSQLFGALFGLNSSIGTAIGNFFSPKGSANGGVIGMASGGKIPAMLTGGEYYISSDAARKIGYTQLNAMNRGYASGGLVMGGSGVKDDVPAMLDAGSFILKKSAVQRYGVGRLNSMVRGVRRAGGGAVFMDLGGDPSMSDITPFDTPDANSVLGGTSDGFSSIGGSSGGNSIFGSFNAAGLGVNLAAGVLLKLIEGLLQPRYGLLDTAQTTANANNIRNTQQGYFSNPSSVPNNVPGYGGSTGGFAYMVPDGNGGYRVVNYGGPAASVTNYSSNGGMISMQGYDSGGTVGPTPGAPSSSSATPQVGVQVIVHNYGASGGVSATTQTQGSDAQSRDFAAKMGQQVQAAVQKQLQEELRSGGLFSQQRRYFPATQQ